MTHISVLRKSYVQRSWNDIPPTQTMFHSSSSLDEPIVPPIFRLTSFRNFGTVRPSGIPLGFRFRMKARSAWIFESDAPRAVSVMTFTSRRKPSTSKNAVKGVQARVCQFTTRIALAPQFGWHEQLSPPNAVSGPRGWWAGQVKAPREPRGYQSRYGSIFPS